jgi:hypothetical protein
MGLAVTCISNLSCRSMHNQRHDDSVSSDKLGHALLLLPLLLPVQASIDCSSDKSGPLQPQASVDSSSAAVPDAATAPETTATAAAVATASVVTAQASCVDSFPGCSGWAVLCAVQAVATYCPCMCSKP